MLSPRRQLADGFTLVEMIVAMVLIIVAVSLASRALIDAFTGQREATQASRNQMSIQDALERFAADVHAARAADRAALDTEELINELQSVPRAGMDVRDILNATRTRLTFRAQVISENAATSGIAPQCITWESTAGGWLQRTVYSGRGSGAQTLSFTGGGSRTCRGAVISSEPMIQLRAPTMSVFTYVQHVNDVDDSAPWDMTNADNCVHVESNASPAYRLPGHPQWMPNSNQRIPDLNRIVAVRLDIRSQVKEGQGRELPDGSHSAATANFNDGAKATVVFRSRTERSYQRALGCAPW